MEEIIPLCHGALLLPTVREWLIVKQSFCFEGLRLPAEFENQPQRAEHFLPTFWGLSVRLCIQVGLRKHKLTEYWHCVCLHTLHVSLCWILFILGHRYTKLDALALACIAYASCQLWAHLITGTGKLQVFDGLIKSSLVRLGRLCGFVLRVWARYRYCPKTAEENSKSISFFPHFLAQIITQILIENWLQLEVVLSIHSFPTKEVFTVFFWNWFLIKKKLCGTLGVFLNLYAPWTPSFRLYHTLMNTHTHTLSHSLSC